MLVDITPHDLPPRCTLFSIEPRVGIKRGYTAGYKTITSDDFRVQAVEKFANKLDQLCEDHFNGQFGTEIKIPNSLLEEAATQAGLPHDVAKWMVDKQFAGMQRFAERYNR